MSQVVIVWKRTKYVHLSYYPIGVCSKQDIPVSTALTSFS